MPDDKEMTLTEDQITVTPTSDSNSSYSSRKATARTQVTSDVDGEAGSGGTDGGGQDGGDGELIPFVPADER